MLWYSFSQKNNYLRKRKAVVLIKVLCFEELIYSGSNTFKICSGSGNGLGSGNCAISAICTVQIFVSVFERFNNFSWSPNEEVLTHFL